MMCPQVAWISKMFLLSSRFDVNTSFRWACHVLLSKEKDCVTTKDVCCDAAVRALASHQRGRLGVLIMWFSLLLD